MHKQWTFVFLFVLSLVFLPFRFASGQDFRGTITGVVTDASKAVVPNATVKVRNIDTGEVRTVTTNASGLYSVSYLHPGQHLEVSVEAPGFKSATYPPVVLSVSQARTANFVLQVGTASEEVTVNSESYLVGLDTEKADRGAVIDNKTITQMPLNGRNALSLMDYLPGVTNEGGAGNEGPGMNVEGTSYYTVNGTPQQNTEYTIDGMPNNALPWYAMNTPSSIPSVDALQEFKVTTSPYDAQYGRTAAGVVSMELKSGTNDLHGTAYEFAKRGFLDANSWENNYAGLNRPAHTEDQYGFEIDGPVYIPHIYNGRRKTFFMFNYEHFKQVLPNFQTYDIPNAAWLQGDFSNFVDASGALMPIFDPTTATTTDPTRQIFQHAGQYNHVNPSRFNPIAVNAINSILAAAKPTTLRFPNELPWEQIWVNTIPFTASSNSYIVKLDQIFGAKDHVSGSWLRSYNPSFSPNTPANVPWYNGGTYTEYHMNTGVDWVHTFRPNLLSDLRFSYQRYWDSDGPTAANLTYNPAQLGFSQSLLNQIPLKQGFPNINFSMQQQTAANGNGYNNWLAMSRDFYYFPNDTYSLAPTVTWIKGKHNLRGGLDFRITHSIKNIQNYNSISITSNGLATSEYWNQNNSNDIPSLPDGTQLSQSGSGNAVLDFLIGQPNSVNVQNQDIPYLTWHYYAPWIQDDWKITPRLTLNLGFRYDLNGPPSARHNWFSGPFNYNVTNPINAAIGAGSGLPTLKGGITYPTNGLPWARDYTKWQPRLGFAWAARPGTVVRGGAGRTVLNSTEEPGTTGFNYPPVYVNSPDGGRTYFPNNLGNPYPTGIPAILGSSQGLLTNVGRSISYANPDYKLPSVVNGSMGVEQAMPHDGKFEISYVMSRAYGLEQNFTSGDTNFALSQSCNATLGSPANPYPQGNCQNLTSNPFYKVPGVSGSLGQNQQTSLLQLARPYPQFTGITETQNNWGHTWYNSLQTTYQQRLGWEQVNASYTWSKTMQSGGYQDDIYLLKTRSIAGTDRQNRITLTSVLNLPIGRGLKYFSGMNRPLDAAIGGWELAGDAFWESGQPVRLLDLSKNIANGTPIYNIVGNIRAPKHSTPEIIDAGVNPCVELWNNATPTQLGYYKIFTTNGQSAASCAGNVAWQQAAPYAPTSVQPYTDQIRGPGANQIDINLSKNFKFTERLTLQLRMEEFNVLNHPTWYGQVDMNPTDTNFGTVNKILTGGQSNNPREGQLGAKLVW